MRPPPTGGSTGMTNVAAATLDRDMDDHEDPDELLTPERAAPTPQNQPTHAPALDRTRRGPRSIQARPGGRTLALPPPRATPRPSRAERRGLDLTAKIGSVLPAPRRWGESGCVPPSPARGAARCRPNPPRGSSRGGSRRSGWGTAYVPPPARRGQPVPPGLSPTSPGPTIAAPASDGAWGERPAPARAARRA